MGNDCPYPKYQYPFPPPAAICWTEYIKQCSLNHENELEDIFEKYYKGRIVEWQGIVTDLATNYCKMLMNPSEATFTNSEVTVNFDPSQNPISSPVFALRKEIRFRARLMKLGGIKNHVLQYVPSTPEFPPDYSLTYEQFLFLFGSSSRHSANGSFDRYWKGKQIILEGRFSSIVHYKPGEQFETTSRFHISDRYTDIRREPITIAVPWGRRQLVRIMERLRGFQDFLIAATFYDIFSGAHVLILEDVYDPVFSAPLDFNFVHSIFGPYRSPPVPSIYLPGPPPAAFPTAYPAPAPGVYPQPVPGPGVPIYPQQPVPPMPGYHPSAYPPSPAGYPPSPAGGYPPSGYPPQGPGMQPAAPGYGPPAQPAYSGAPIPSVGQAYPSQPPAGYPPQSCPPMGTATTTPPLPPTGMPPQDPRAPAGFSPPYATSAPAAAAGPLANATAPPAVPIGGEGDGKEMPALPTAIGGTPMPPTGPPPLPTGGMISGEYDRERMLE
ncbi:uncharacterized protein MONOS_924 [Monocercomonoides exilis]|uniref:uncharacterized protein n=1 Tax=Monocercomonoides exilis TaxID=2049356 RepID=UPI00355A84F5|nr:hypothetical protein MONOS_924 [Monocercomonoides exilis]|eukprot:MONOS_924.1-p1 / transcript=MONOS_924.1 / gene=MONOS_924 / organism=Monocercomonoides_exilis_PA203 / gene_product=unspecified product / transcript_product=unspecified product / location=Mono_scaffold00015:151591-153431(+) / protein_length=495 / sequence_SO=supercontig / SO=protein_coding / is_pseudo=false